MRFHKLPLIVAAAACAGAAIPAQGRQQIRIVGSSTVYPFSSFVAEEFGETSEYPIPVVESTGSGGGHKLFYAGAGPSHPDITNSSRRIKPSELAECQKNDVGPVIELRIGFDGIALCQNLENEPLDLHIDEIVLAVAEEVPAKKPGGDGVVLVPNPHKYWDEIAPRLPHRKILLLGPPTTSGTRDAFHELVMHPGAKLLGYPEDEHGRVEYQNIRQDGAWIDSGENDNLIVQKLTRDRVAIGVFGYSFLVENKDRIRAITIHEVPPTPATISSGEYPVSRSLFFYVKARHLPVIPGLEEFVDLFLSEDMIGPDGALAEIGLIPLPDEEREGLRALWKKRVPLTLDALKD